MVSPPESTITWQPVSNFPAPNYDNMYPAVHPTDPLRALVGGLTPIRYTTDGGASWQSGNGLDGLNPGVPAWVPGGVGNGQSALQVSLSQETPEQSLTPGPTGNALNFARSTDGGANWSPPITMTIPGVAENLPYLWADANQSSPYYGRIYLTLTMLDTARTGSFDTVAALYSTDGGATWGTPVGLVDPTELAPGANYNAFSSAAIQPSGAVVVAWHRGTCCQTITNVPNKVMWSRSTDGGVTFPVSGTIATVPVSQSLEYKSMAPSTANFRWTPAPNIAADPVDGTLYAVWVAYRQPNTPASAAVYLSRSTDNGASWSTPVVAGTGNYQYWYLPWVQVSPDHMVHLTFQGALVTDFAAHFYVQSTDRGATWSTPFQLGGGSYTYVGQGDYQATSLGGYNGSQGTIFTSWQILINSSVRSGTFPLGGGSTPSPTTTATATPTTTSTATRTLSTTPTSTRTSTIAVPSQTVVPSSTVPVPPSNTPPASTPTPALPTNTSVATTPTPTAAACTITFSDVPPDSTFYPYIRCLACRGIISGYNDSTFKPFNNITRGQISKMVSNAAAFSDPIPSTQQTYEDVPFSNTFWLGVERLTMHNVMTGYRCGGVGEPCTPPLNRPYFRWANNATRSQLSKIVANAYGNYPTPTAQMFEDVPPDHPFYMWIEQLAEAGVIGGYQCGSEGEPCIPPLNRPYFRPYNNVTREQASKIVANVFYPNCQTLGRNQSLK